MTLERTTTWNESHDYAIKFKVACTKYDWRQVTQVDYFHQLTFLELAVTVLGRYDADHIYSTIP